MEDQSWKGLKETAGSSSQVRHHVGAVCFLLSFSFVSLNFEHIGASVLSKLVNVL